MNNSRGRNRPPLSLHIPEPPARPGEEADFSHIQVTPAGVTPRPDSFAAAHDLRDMAFGLVRVLDDAGQAVGPWNPRLSPDMLRAILRHMALKRIANRPKASPDRNSERHLWRTSGCSALQCRYQRH